MNVLRNIKRRIRLARARREERNLPATLRHELAVCAIFREEAPFLAEWIAFHESVGATHFYLYNNFSTDSFADVLAPFLKRGLVTLRNWPKNVGQVSAYEDCVRRDRKHARWIAFLDIDEFLFSPETRDIRPILARFSGYPGVLIYGLFFGSSGHETRPDAPLLDSFTWRARPETVNSGKTIANPRFVYKIRSPHILKYCDADCVDTRGRSHDAGRHDAPYELLRYNHYWSRSLSDLRTKVSRGDASTADPRKLDWHLEFEKTLHEIEDTSLVGWKHDLP